MIKQRIDKMRNLMKEKNIYAYIVPSSDYHQSEYVGDYFKSREFMSGFTGSAGTLIISMDEVGLWTDGRYFIQAENELKGSDIKLFKMGEEGVPTILEYLLEKLPKNSTLGFDGRVMSVKEGQNFANKLAFKNIIIDYKYDLVNDYNYYLPDDLISTPQAFYEYDSNGFPIEETVEIRYIPTFNDFGNYLKSVTCIKNKKLLAGTMPVNVNDIVIYGDKNDVGQKRTIYFQIRGERGWNVTSYIALEMTVSGVLSRDNNFSKDQVYYSEQFCKQMVYNSKITNRKLLCYSNAPIEVTPFNPSSKYVYVFVDDIGENNIKLSQSFFGESRIRNIYNRSEERV
jgi:hypothetical protein